MSVRTYKSPILNDVMSLMLWYAPIRFSEQPPTFPNSFPCIAIVMQIDPIATKVQKTLESPHEGLVYIYPDDFPVSKSAKMSNALGMKNSLNKNVVVPNKMKVTSSKYCKPVVKNRNRR